HRNAQGGAAQPIGGATLAERIPECEAKEGSDSDAPGQNVREVEQQEQQRDDGARAKVSVRRTRVPARVAERDKRQHNADAEVVKTHVQRVTVYEWKRQQRD